MSKTKSADYNKSNYGRIIKVYGFRAVKPIGMDADGVPIAVIRYKNKATKVRWSDECKSWVMEEG